MEQPQIVTEQVPASAIPPVKLSPEESKAAEQKVEAPKEPEKKEESVSSKFAALAAKDKAFQKRQQELSEKEKVWQDRLAKAEATEKRFEELKRTAKLDPVKAMKEALDIDYEYTTEFILNKGKPSADAKYEQLRQDMVAFMESTKKEKEEAKAAEEKRNAEYVNSTIAQTKQSIDQYMKSDPKKFEFLNFLDSKGLVDADELIYQGAELTHKQTGKIPTIAEATEGVQEYLLGQFEELVNQVSYFKEKYGPKGVAATKTPDGATPTISNSMNGGTEPRTPAANEEERMRRALAAMEAAEKSV